MVHGTLDTWVEELNQLALAANLRPLPTEFQVVSDEVIYTLSSYLVPGRYRHWSYGERYWIAKQQDERRLGRIYELVVNGDPAIAYLLDKNPDAYHVLVIGHVLAHADFFAHNRWLSQVRRQNVGLWFREHAQWIENLHQQHGFARASALLDAARTLYQLIDSHYRPPTLERSPLAPEPAPAPFDWVRHLYDEPKFEPLEAPSAPTYRVWPKTRDVLALMGDLGRLDEDERVAIAMLREEMLYFRPQQETKVMNEGWATYWHVRLIRHFSQWDDQDHIEAMRLHAQVTQPSQLLNPYYLGWTLWELLAESFGLTRCQTMIEQETDQSWIRQWFSDDVVRLGQDRHLLPDHRPISPDDPKGESEYYPPAELKEDIQRAFVVDTPEIIVSAIDPDTHRLTLSYEGKNPLHPSYTQDVVDAIAFLWGGPVSLVSHHRTWQGDEHAWQKRG